MFKWVDSSLWAWSLCYFFLPLEVAVPPQCAAAARSSPVRGSRVSATPAAPLCIFQLTLRFRDSFISVRADWGLSGRDLSIHPSIYPTVCPAVTSAALLSSSGAPRPHLHLGRSDINFDQRTWQLFYFFFLRNSSPPDQRFTTGRLLLRSAVWWVLLPLFSREVETALQHWGVEMIKPVVRPGD